MRRQQGSIQYVVVSLWTYCQTLRGIRPTVGPGYVWIGTEDHIVKIYSDIGMGEIPAGSLAFDALLLRNYIALI